MPSADEMFDAAFAALERQTGTSSRDKLLSALLSQQPQGHQTSYLPSPFFSKDRPYQEINDAGMALGRDGAVGLIERALGREMSPVRRIGAAWSDALPMEHWGR